MHDLERYLIWGAIIVLFVLYFWPKMSGCTGEPNSITKLAEFSSLSVDIQKIYNDNILRAIKAWAPTINKWWDDIPPADKVFLKNKIKATADQQVTNANNGRNRNGVEVLKMVMNRLSPSGGEMPPVSVQSNATPQYSISKYMTQPFNPMISGFSLDAVIDKVNNATKI